MADRNLPLGLPQELIIEANAESLERFLESVESFVTHLRGKPDASFRSDDRGPIIFDHALIFDHAFGITLFHAHDGVADALFQLLGGDRRL